MARIRSVKPEFWTDEKIVTISPLARLLFMGLWNFADDDGRMVHSPTRIKLQILPADSADISELLGEIRGKEMIDVYSVDGVEYLQIVNFHKHQKVDKRTASKYPPHINGSANSPRVLARNSLGGEGIKEGIKDQGRDQGAELSLAPASVAKPGVPPCPHDEIIDLYHEILPMGVQVHKKLWTGTRKTYLQTRWREDEERQNLLWWGKFFHYCSESDFLTGRTQPRQGRDPFRVTLEWIVTAGNFVKIHEGTYHR